MASIRLFVPRASLNFHSRQLQRSLRMTTIRAASTAPPKPRVLEKPERFNPPSHPSRLRARPRQYPGPPLSEHERQAQKTKRYPHMMPPQGTFMHRILTDKLLHVWITMGILIALMLNIWWQDFMLNAPDTHLLPPNSMFFSHPSTFIHRYITVYLCYIEHNTATSVDRRKRQAEDAFKAGQFRKAHDLNPTEGIRGWLAKTNDEAEEEEQQQQKQKEEPAVADQSHGVLNVQDHIDVEAPSSPVQKRWFGIW